MGLRTVAVPSISSNLFGYPPEDAAKVAVSTVYRYLGQLSLVVTEEVFLVLLVCFAAQDKNLVHFDAVVFIGINLGQTNLYKKLMGTVGRDIIAPQSVKTRNLGVLEVSGRV